MAALATATKTSMRILKSKPMNFKVANGITIYLGGLVGLATASFVPVTAKRGYAIPHDNIANIEYLGIAIGSPFSLSTSNTVVGSTSPGSGNVVPEISVETGEIILLGVTVTGVSAQSDVGKAIYGATDNVNDLTVTSNNTPYIGEVERWISSTTCDVRLFGRDAWIAQNA